MSARKTCSRCSCEIHDELSPEHAEIGQAVVSWSGHESGRSAPDKPGGWPFPASARQFNGSALLCRCCSLEFLAFMQERPGREALQFPQEQEVARRTSTPPSRSDIAQTMRRVVEETERTARSPSKPGRVVRNAEDRTPEGIRRMWLGGTTCACKPRDVREVMFASETHIVLKHRSHAEYIDRGSGSGTCTAYARLYLIDALVGELDFTGGRNAKPVKEWTGRINPRVVREECAALGVNFEMEPHA